MLLDDVINFLKKIPPFQFLSEGELSKIAANTTLDFYPKNTVLLQQGGEPADTLKIIKKGSVKVTVHTHDGQDAIVDYRSEGEMIGYISIFSSDRARANVITIDDTICYNIPKSIMQQLIDTNPEVKSFFHQSFLSKYLDKTFKEMQHRTLTTGSTDMLLFNTTVGELATQNVITIFKDFSIQQAAQKMAKHNISSLIITDEYDAPVGIITDRDLRAKVVAKGRDINEPVSTVMSSSLIKSDAREYCFEALLKMIRHNIHHLVVVEEGCIAGIITNHDLMVLQGTSPVTIAKDIEGQYKIEGLAQISQKTFSLIELLLKEGAKAINVAKVMTEINDRILKKVLELTEKSIGTPPVSYCWIVFGSEGRKEQTFRTDQDNALIYEDINDLSKEIVVQKYFEEFTNLANENLIKCGFPQCPGNYMASNPTWRQPLRVWKKYFSDWIETPTPEAVLMSVILFDFRPVYGNFNLAEILKNHLTETLKNQDMFLVQIAKLATNIKPPLSFFKTFVVEKGGEHKNTLNLKQKCIAPLINIIRLYALEKRINETSTTERIEKLRNIHNTVKEYADELLHAFDFLMLLRLHHQYEQICQGKEPDNFINPDNLTHLQKRTLKEVCQLIMKLQDFIESKYMLGRI